MRHAVDYIKKNPLLFLVIFPGLIFHMMITLPSGSYYCVLDRCGYFFWGAHGHDGIWHLAIESAALRHIPFVAPTYAGALLSGYNYLLDLGVYALSMLHISPMLTYFKIIPIMWFIGFTLALVYFGQKLEKSPLFVGILLFFGYFGTSFSYLITWLHDKTIWGSSGVLAMQAGQSLINIQFACSLVFLLFILTILKNGRLNVRIAGMLGVLFAIMLGLKFYGGVVSAILIGMFIVTYSIQQRSIRKVVVPALIIAACGLVSIFIFYNPLAKGSGSVLSFAPLAIVHPIIEDPSLLYMKDTVNARYFLQAQGIGFKLIRIEIMTLFLFVVLNLGTRVVGVIDLVNRGARRKISSIDWYIVSGIIGATLMAILFVQRGEWWNTIQFFYYAIFLSNVFAARFVYSLIKRYRTVGILVAFILLILTLPADIDLMKGFTEFPAPSYISDDEVKTLHRLGSLPQGVVLTPLYQRGIASPSKAPYPLYAYDDTSYVPAFSGQQIYLGDEVQLRLMGISYEKRREQVKSHDCAVLNDIDYVYDLRANPILRQFKACHVRFTQVFATNTAVIYSKMK